MRLRHHVLLVAPALATCLVVRVAHATSDRARLEADEAVTGLMALRILDGELFTFYAGQTYMGALEQYVQAVVLAFAEPTTLALRSVPIAITVATCAVVYVLGLRILRTPWHAALAAMLFAVGPAYSVHKGIKSHGAYSSAQLIAALGLLAALAYSPQRRRAPLLVAAFGALCGLGAWQNLQTAYVLVPAAVWILAEARGQRVRTVALGALGFVAGSLPLIVWGLRWRDLPRPGGQPPSTIVERAETLYEQVIPAFVGVASTGGGALYTWLPTSLLSPLLVALLVVVAARRRHELWALVRLAPGRARPVDVVLLAFVLAPFIFVSSKYSWYGFEPRYLYVLYVVLPIGLAALVPRNARAALPAGVALLVGAAALSQEGLARGGPITPPPEHFRAAARIVQAEGSPTVYADYWLAYVLEYFAEREVSVSPFYAPRFPADTRRSDRPAYLALRDDAPSAGFSAPGRSETVERALDSAGVRYRTVRAGDLVLYTDISPPRTASEVGLEECEFDRVRGFICGPP